MNSIACSPLTSNPAKNRHHLSANSLHKYVRFLQGVQLNNATIVILDTTEFTKRFIGETFHNFSPLFKICNLNFFMYHLV